MRHQPEIDGLRAVAVLPVAFYHAGVPGFGGGFVGVDVFFVISGYLITGLIKEELEQGRFSILNFYNRRIRRILPALVFFVALTALLSFTVLLPSFLKDFGESTLATAGFLSNFYFWQNSGYFEVGAQMRPLLHTWSLAVEEQFYIFMPLAAYLVHRFLGRRWLLIFGAGAIASFVLSVYAMGIGPTATFFLLPTRAWELLVGALLACWPRPVRREGAAAQALSLLGLGLIAYSVVGYSESTPFPGLAAAPPCLGAALILAFADPKATWVGRLLSTPPMIGVGLISYSLYLAHWPVIVFYRYLTLQPPGFWGALVVLPSSVALAAFSWKFVEQPFRRARAGGVRASNLRVLGWGAAALAAMAVVGGAAATGHGLTPAPKYSVTASAGDASWDGGPCFFMNNYVPGAWRAEKCEINPEGDAPTLLWGDSFAMHYGSGVAAVAPGTHSRVYVYTFAGCPPVLSYASYARPSCQPFNQNALAVIDELHIKRVVLAARWVDMRLRGLDQLHSTIDALRAKGVDVFVIGQSPMFITDTPVIAALKPKTDAWKLAIDASINAALKRAAVGATYIDPLPFLCEGDLCRYRDGEGGRFLYADYGHFSGYGSRLAVSSYFPLQR
jgi:peptidoglycan/LPS O-acetylase OafA/YrhL